MKRIVVAASCLLPLAILQASPNTEAIQGMWAAGAVKYGVSMIKLIAASDTTPIPRSTSSLSTQQQAINKVINSYKSRRDAMRMTNDGMRTTAQFAVDGTAATLYATGVGIVPAVALQTAGTLGVNVYFDNLDVETGKALKGFLANKKNLLIEIGGVKYEDLRKLPASDIRDRITSYSQLFKDMDKVLPDDENVKEFARTLVVDTIKNTQMATLDRLAKQEQDVSLLGSKVVELKKEYTEFKNITIDALNKHGNELDTLGSAIGDLEKSMGSINQRLQRQERDQGFVADFVFTRVDPATKVKMLKGGFQSERFSCKDGSPTCEQSMLKNDLIKRFEAEARIQEISANLGKSAETLGNVSALAKSLGLNIPELDKIAQLGSVASNAFSQAATGNYLGAAVAVTGLFRSQRDPDQERFEMMMGYLKVEFAEVNAKLDAILDNQQTIVSAIGDLSEQLQVTYQALDQRLARMEFETKRVSDVVRFSAWKDWMPCYAIYEYVAQNEQRFGVLARGDFSSMQDIQTVISVHRGALDECITIAESRPISLTAPNRFGNFLDASKAVQYMPPELPEDEARTNQYHTRTELEKYISDVYRPSVLILDYWLKQNNVTWAQAYALLSTPRASIHETDTALVNIKSTKKLPCEIGSFLTERGQRLLCQHPSGPDAAAFTLLSQPMVVDSALDISKWLLIVSRFADVRDGNTGNYLRGNQLLDAAARLEESSAGREIVEKTALMLDAAIAGYSLLYGDLLASAITDILVTPVSKDPNLEAERLEILQIAINLLKSNGALRSNVVLIDMYKRYGKQTIDDSKTSPLQPSEHIYRIAYDSALGANSSTRPANTSSMDLLNGLFGDDVSFKVEDQKQEVLFHFPDTLEISELSTPLPEPAMFIEGRITYPEKLFPLLQMREILSERLLDYDALAGLTGQEVIDFSLLAAQFGRASSFQVQN